MGFVEDILVSKESTKTGISAKQDRSSAVFDAGIVIRIGIAKDTSAQGDELFAMLSFD
jgi:hypothetical protein